MNCMIYIYNIVVATLWTLTNLLTVYKNMYVLHTVCVFKSATVDYLINAYYNSIIKVDKEDMHNVRYKHARKVIKRLYNSC